jgi:hypothetical protein
VGLEGVLVQTNNGQDTSAVGNPAPDAFVTGIVESPLGKDDRGPAPRFEKL